MTTFIQITFTLAILALVIFITMMLTSGYYHLKNKRKREALHNTLQSAINYGDIQDVEFWKSFKPGECVVFDGYLAKDDYGMAFYKSKPVRRENKKGVAYFTQPGECDEEELPSFMQRDLSLTKYGQARKVYIKVVVSSVIEEAENENI